MKKLVLSITLFALSSVVFAASDSGCGVGTMIFEGKEGVAPNVLAVTTNGTLGNQTFAMSTGTLGCDNSMSNGFWAVNQYMDANMDKVARDMSRGQGESIDNLAALFYIKEQHRPEFFRVMQENFALIFPNSDVTRKEVVDSLLAVMESSPILEQYAIRS